MFRIEMALIANTHIEFRFICIHQIGMSAILSN